MDRASDDGVVDWAAALLAHNALLRGGEVGVPDGAEPDLARVLTWGSFSWQPPRAESGGRPWLIARVVPIKDPRGSKSAYPIPVARRHDGLVEAWAIEHPDAAPAYLSYLVDPERLATYLSCHGERVVTHYVDGERASVTETHVAGAPYAMSWAFESERYASVAVMSDGVAALRDGDRRPVPIGEALATLMSFKRLRGRFVRRRLRAAIKRGGLDLGDDLSMAALAAAPREEEAAA